MTAPAFGSGSARKGQRRLGLISSTIFLLAAGLMGLSPVPASGQPTRSVAPQAANGSGPIVRAAVAHDVSQPLRDIPPIAPEPGLETEPGPLPTVGGTTRAADPVLQTSSPSASIPSPNKTFDGQNVGDDGLLGLAPPDTVGDVGPNHYVQWVNVVFSIYDKDGTRLYGPAAGNTLWDGFAGECAVHNWGDPIVQYDPIADRWMMSQFAFARDPLATGLPVPPYYQCIAVSQTGDPTGAYNRYQFTISATKLNDYPHFGVWPDAYYMSINQFATDDDGLLQFAGAGAIAFERDAMLAGQQARMVYFDEETTYPQGGGQLPSDLDGFALPPPGSPNYFMQFEDSATSGQDKLDLFKFHVDWANPANSTFTLANQLAVADFDSNMCNFANDRDCIPQKGNVADDRLDSLADRLMYRLAYRNFGDHEALVMNHTVDIDNTDHAGIRWYEVRDPAGTPTVFQQGTYAGSPADGKHRWMGSISQDRAGDIAIGYSVSSATTFPGINYAGRLAGDPPGVMSLSEGKMFAGTGAQVGTSNRWGDYSSLNVDPTDDCTFWYTQEYYGSTGSYGWRTRIGSFTFPSCLSAAGADLEVTMAGDPAAAAIGDDITYTIGVQNNGPQSAPGVLVTDPLPVGMALLSASPSQGTCSGTATVTCTLGELGSGESASVLITAEAPRTQGDVTNSVTVASQVPDPNGENNTGSVVTPVVNPCVTPGLTILTDTADDETGGIAAHDIRSISISEPYVAGVQKLAVTLKMADLSSLPPSTRWILFFTAPDDTAKFVEMRTDALSTPVFQYGTTTVNTAVNGGYYNLGTVAGQADPVSNYKPDGTITIQVSASAVGNPTAGQTLTKFLSQISQSTPAGTLNVDFAPNTPKAPAGEYTLFGSSFCSPGSAPMAVLTSTPTSGNAPLTVTLDGSGSTDPDGDTISDYTFDFGDGTAPFTTAASSVQHTYQDRGIYQASLTVTDAPGLTSTNPARVNITAGPIPPITFGPSTVIDAQRTEGEPLNFIDRNGDYWESGPWGTHNQQSFIHRSVDGGEQFNIVSPVKVRPDPGGPGGGDTDIVVDDQGTAYFTDLEALLALDVAVSNDHGNTWRRNSVGQVLPGIDRQWFTIDDGVDHSIGAAGAADNTVFLAYHDASGIFVTSSPGSTGVTDPIGGLVYTPTSVGPIAGDARCGQIRFDPVNRNLYYPCAATGSGAAARRVRMSIAHVNVGQRTGLTWTNVNLPNSPGGGGVATQLFPVVATDQAGNAYAAWIDSANSQVYYTWSSTPTVASSWSVPLQVSSGAAKTNVMPWIQAGAPGTVAVAWYGTSTSGNPNNFPSWFVNRQTATNVKWFGYVSMITGANSPSPAFAQAPFTEKPMYYGEVCTSGTTCLADLGDRTLADFFGFSMDPDGAIRIVYNDVSSQHHGAHLFEARQLTGLTLKGTVIDKPRPENPAIDPTGDAQWPHYAPVTGPGANLPRFDLTKVELSTPGGETLRVQMSVDDLSSLAPPPNEQTGVWLTRFQARSLGEGGEEAYRIFYVGAESNGGAPMFFAGSGDASNPDTDASGDGCVQTLPGAGAGCKIVQYPREVTATGSIDQAAGTITIDVPIQGGFGPNRPIQDTTLFNVTGLTFGRKNATADLYADIDATRSFDYSWSRADLSIVKQDDRDPIPVRQALLYQMQVRNDGPGEATNVVVTDELSDKVSFARATPSQGTCSGTVTVTCSLGSIPSGGTATIALRVVTVKSGTAVNSASVSSDSEDLASGNDTATATTLITGRSCTIIGTAKSETLTGTSGTDLICGLGGNDVIEAAGGKDVLYGMRGSDTMRGQDGDDVFFGGPGGDVFDGGEGRDTAWFTEGNVTGGSTVDLAAGTAVNPTLGRDTFTSSNGRSSVENIVGTPFADQVSGDAGPNRVNGLSGDDQLYGMGERDFLVGEAGDDLMDGGNGIDRCDDTQGTNTFVSCERSGTAAGQEVLAPRGQAAVLREES